MVEKLIYIARGVAECPCLALRPESNLSVKYERNGSLLSFRASNSVYDRVSAVSHCFCNNGARTGSNRFLVDFLPSERRLHVQQGRQKELGRP